ncbi:MAG: SDR family NAD(P)-dependent oxidoreductase [Verrucomicrobia bacterium]|nr:MAG: SDR family NAD(P)-dependent oxidoreductase [Verrucomicrobiota bacterium]
MTLFMNFSFNHSCVLITGASAGLGAEFARQLAPHAATLILVARRRERLEKLADDLQKKYPELHVYLQVCDLTSIDEREKLVAWVREEELPLNFVINNAGLGNLGEFHDASWQRIQGILDLNIGALTHLTHLLLPILRKQAPSALLQVGSIVGFFPIEGHAVYAASKAYVQSFTQALHLEEEKHGVHVILLAPGAVPTEFFKVASRLQEPISLTSRSPACFITSPEKVVAVALEAVVKKRAIVIPNKLLSIVVQFLRFAPIFLFQKVFLKNKKR